jgi:DNA-binding CsgD family transcriptional regulator
MKIFRVRLSRFRTEIRLLVTKTISAHKEPAMLTIQESLSPSVIGGPVYNFRIEVESLSDRERDCLTLMADGWRDKETASRIGITEATVRFHIDNARKKLGAKNRPHAVARLANFRLF